MMSTDVTSANIYQYLQGAEEGIGTICEDEADDLDEDREKMRIYKNGYTTGHPVFRTDTSYGRKQIRFYTFCFKAFAAERLPDSLKAKGFNQRTIEIHCVYGFPQYDISEVLNPAGDEKHEKLLDELLDMRKRLLIYRLLHHSDKIPDIKVNLENKEKQLFKPLLRIFQNTETINELVPVISKFVAQKRLKNMNTLNAFLYRIVKDLIKKENSYELSSSSIWQTITDPEILAGEPVPNKKLSYNSVEFGEISQKQITQIFIDVFGATKPKRHGSSNKLIFDQEKMKRLGRIYEISLEVRINGDGIDGIDGIDIGLQKHFIDLDQNLKSSDSINSSLDCYNNSDQSNLRQIAPERETISSNLTNPSQAPQHPQNKLLKCPLCKFKNIHPEEINHHLRWKHGKGA